MHTAKLLAHGKGGVSRSERDVWGVAATDKFFHRPYNFAEAPVAT